MAEYRILPPERDEKSGKVTKISMIYKAIEITFVPDYPNNSFSFTKTNLLGKKNTLIPKDIFNRMSKQAGGIFFSRREKNISVIPFPGQEELIEEATLLNNQITILRENYPKKTNKELSERILKSKTGIPRLQADDFKGMNGFKSKWLFDLGKFGIRINSNGWIVINGGKKIILFNLEKAIRMQDHILETYQGKESISEQGILKEMDIVSLAEKRKQILKKCNNEMNKKLAEILTELKAFTLMRGFAGYPENVNVANIESIQYALENLFIGGFYLKKKQADFFLNLAKNYVSESRKAKKYLRIALSVLQS